MHGIVSEPAASPCRNSFQSLMSNAKTQPEAPPRRRPCPFCGALLREDAMQCPRCRLAQDEATVEKVRRISGPWQVLNSRLPTGPGVDWPKLARMVKGGKIYPHSIVRGPSTGNLWRLARNTPGLAELLGVCPTCNATAAPHHARCNHCGGALQFDPPQPMLPDAAALGGEGDPGDTLEIDLGPLDELASAAPATQIGQARRRRRGSEAVPMATGFVIALLLAGVVFVALNQHQHNTVERWVGQQPVETGQAQTPARSQPSQSGPAAGIGAQPGELFPHIPPTPAPSTPETQPGLTDRDRQRIDSLYAVAQAKAEQGELMLAQDRLLELLNEYPRHAWPDGAEALFESIQAQIRRPASRPSFFGPGPETAPR